MGNFPLSVRGAQLVERESVAVGRLVRLGRGGGRRVPAAAARAGGAHASGGGRAGAEAG
eukprot:CAMPEP_0113244188 /NCGR_PEP_ID=MMETSP0008_2-20120614/8263_1 /TAXON_ID=97485 /ORGANISM="Prymnesium parvum" /LENGTH=58 /DNA_ID=CAMNT_0000091779 /DNA_START=1658 /DNA_END=1830 /DNA_ORIENTATION=+ /assembly_acc=CAM_ASM_000153